MQADTNMSPEEIVRRLQNGETLLISGESVSVSTPPEPQTETSVLPTLTVKDDEGVISSSELPVAPNLPVGPAEGGATTSNMEQLNTARRGISSQGESHDSQNTVEHDCENTRVNSLARCQSQQLDFDGIDIKDPVELLAMLDENILSGETKLHDWQIQFMIDFANPSHTKRSPFRAVVQACNGSGKDKYIIAACAVWICMRYREVECPITSSSGAQLDNQTGAHIDRLCAKANAVFGKLWKINYRYYEFQHVGEIGQPMPSKLKLFATDEAGKAEGYHPVDAGKKMAIFTSETKSIPEEITSALTRCTGFTHRVDASSPGLPAGYFYNQCMSAIDRCDIEDIKQLNSSQSLRYKVTAYMCSHILPEEIEAFAASLPGGKNSVVFKSGMLAEFGTTDEMVVIPSSYVEKACSINFNCKTVWLTDGFPTGGLDLSDGGAETVFIPREGNKQVGLEAFRFEDSEDTLDYLGEKFKHYGFLDTRALIFGDYCGLGGPMLRSLKRRGWKNIRFIDSRNKAAEPKTYANRGTELFFNMRKLMEGQELILMDDKLLKTQLATRYYKITAKNIHQLLSKLEQKAKGYPSPDRADALNLAFCNYKSTMAESVMAEPLVEPKDEVIQKEIGAFDMKDWSNRSIKKDQVQHDVPKEDLEYLRDEIAQWNKQRITNKLLSK